MARVHDVSKQNGPREGVAKWSGDGPVSTLALPDDRNALEPVRLRTRRAKRASSVTCTLTKVILKSDTATAALTYQLSIAH